MRKLKVRDFSCIKNADVEFNKLTVFIGPQASGKSVICKLAYYFIDILGSLKEFAKPGCTFVAYKAQVIAKFSEWFPPSAWGDKKFTLEFSAGKYHISINRVVYRKKVSPNFRVKFSPEFESMFLVIESQLTKQDAKKRKSVGWDFERSYETRLLVEKHIESLLGKDDIRSQMFIPAGRSFFTSIGKMVAAFEQGRLLDPVILRFARVFAAYKDHRGGYYYEDSPSNNFEELFATLLGGKLVLHGEQEVVECPDGRKVPLSSLSSGQQELLPLVAVLPHSLLRGVKQAVYIEEPEAHLFPAAQSKLIEILTAFLGVSGSSTEMVLTTHSPYVLVKINNLIKAGQLGRSNSARRVEVANVVPRQSWLGARAVNSYAIQDGVVVSIVDGDGLIAADYLDDVSSDLSKEFFKLLAIEDGE